MCLISAICMLLKVALSYCCISESFIELTCCIVSRRLARNYYRGILVTIQKALVAD